MMRFSILALFAGLVSCAKPPPPAPGPVTFTIGQPYLAGGEWRYPRNFNFYNVTGLATVYGDDAPVFTADNERYDAAAFAAASPVLPLPAIVTVTNLQTGYSMDVRVNDRGPAIPGRILEVTPAVAQKLGFSSDAATQVQVVLNTQETAQLDGDLGQGPKLAAAPVAGITAQSLGPPGSAAAGAVQNLTPQGGSAGPADDIVLSGQVTAGPPESGPLFVQIPAFGREFDAFRMSQRLYGMQSKIVPQFDPSRTLYAVDVGPFYSVADADAALAQILERGVTDPEIVVR
jgi:rare lipoprotein A